MGPSIDDYGPIRTEDERAVTADLVAWCFNIPKADAETFMSSSGVEHFRVLRQAGKVVACLLLVPMGQFFGGRRVATNGVVAVAVAPERRGTGAATALMNAAMGELLEGGCALSTLYATSRSLYRKSGFEPAGGRFVATVPIHAVGSRDRDLELRPMTEGDREEVESVYRAQASKSSGNLDRGPYMWRRVFTPRGKVVKGFVVTRGGSIEGYAAYYEHARAAGDLGFTLVFTDLVALTPEAGKRLLTFVADHGTLVAEARWATGPSDPLLQMLREPGYKLELEHHWMLRVVDVQAALAARGYLEGIETELHLEVRDDLLPNNDGRFVLSVAGGRGEVRRGGRGRLQLDVRGLAPLFSGMLLPNALEAAGLLEATEAELAKATTVFAAPFPWMPDMF